MTSSTRKRKPRKPKGRMTKREKLVRDAAERAGLNMADVADQMGIAATTLHSNLRTAQPTSKTLARIRDWLSARGVRKSVRSLRG